METMHSQLPDNVQALLLALKQGLLTLLGDKLYGIYVYGALVFPGAAPTGDIDFHVVLSQCLSQPEVDEIKKLHTALVRDFHPPGDDLDGYYVLLEETGTNKLPEHQLIPGFYDASWALIRAHLLAGCCLVLYGPHPGEIFPEPGWEELAQALLDGELKFIAEHLTEYPDYCILNLSRILYSFTNRDVVISKMDAAFWMETQFPEWRRIINLARKSYARQATAEDRQLMLAAVDDLYRFVCQKIRHLK